MACNYDARRRRRMIQGTTMQETEGTIIEMLSLSRQQWKNWPYIADQTVHSQNRREGRVLVDMLMTGCGSFLLILLFPQRNRKQDEQVRMGMNKLLGV